LNLLLYLEMAIFAIWCISEILFSWRSHRNLAAAISETKDRLSYFGMWLSIIPPVAFAITVRSHSAFPTAIGSFSIWARPLSFAGCLIVLFGISIRLVSVVTLQRQFTDRVAIVANHKLVASGIYKMIRHPAYLGHLFSLFGIGLISGNVFALAALVVLPAAATLYRIRVEERALINHFGVAYQAYANRTKKLLPGIY
jgi:protein-S-isoprenylcysteine O-methyltransferase Ste14